MTVKIKTDLDAADNTWRIIDCDGNVVKEFGPYPDGLVEEYTEQLSLEKGKIYGIEIFDCWGDGVRHRESEVFPGGGKGALLPDKPGIFFCPQVLKKGESQDQEKDNTSYFHTLTHTLMISIRFASASRFSSSVNR